MKVSKDSVVGLEYRLHLGDGKAVDQSPPGKPLQYLHGHGQIVPGLERAMEGLSVGDTKTVVVAPADGYGEHDPEGVQEVPRSMFPASITPTVGQQLSAEGPGGEQVAFEIKRVGPDKVQIDLNHPLAGKTLHFDVNVREVRAATDEEKTHGHAHGGDGHHH